MLRCGSPGFKAGLSSLPAQTKLMTFGYKNQEGLDRQRFEQAKSNQ